MSEKISKDIKMFDIDLVGGHDGKYYDQSKIDKYKKTNSKIECKECIKCKKSLPITEEYFYRDKYRKDGFFAVCKECKKKEYREYRKKKKEMEGKTDDERMLIDFAEDFNKFLESNPKIGFNLYNSLQIINKEFKYILKNLLKKV